ncbi:hypothetical protein GRI34_10725 [Erythrobacter aquimaris]|uniref:Uncharacterized protein n=1 Tax=Qipengyuania aquimaris TaxID=255984 RepID=A0A6I4TQL7_9SPHN|nr:hypothetical protein [Qipengyuania aquimaris]MXO96888.1 hypothetical protein [Qipengyuania aquimaris]
MTDSKRRSVLHAIGALALLPLAGTRAVAASRAAVSFPQGPIRLRRKLVRSLKDGASIDVVREWSCRFEKLGAGARMQGHQVAVEVAAPPPLKAMAAIEEARDASGFLPLELDRTGLIVDWSRATGSGVDQAVRRALDMVEETVAKADEKQTSKEFVTSVGSMAAELVSQIPRDLLFPTPGGHVEARPVELADGLAGSFEVAIAAQIHAESGLLRSFERTVTTRVGDSVRLSSETWEIL